VESLLHKNNTLIAITGLICKNGFAASGKTHGRRIGRRWNGFGIS
jgi:hypothetical protein